MAEFNLQITVEGNDTTTERVEDHLSSVVESYETVTFGEPEESADAPDWLLEIERIDTYAAVYTELNDVDQTLDIGLWGPTADRFPVPVQHYALQQISMPDSYEFHALDNKVTLVIADSKMDVQRLEQEVPPPALG
jgi:hypothetical protein